MALGIGIDTGGTYTDAVIYDFSSESVVCSSKARTTHDFLEEGIINALNQLDQSYFDKIEIVALSTTLATNACVENRGGRAKLIFFGVDKKVFDMVGKNYGLVNKDEVYLCDNASDFNGSTAEEPDWDKLFDNLADWLKDAQGLGIVEVFAMNNGAMLEKKAKEQVSKKYDIPVVCGHELFYELNSIQRGSSTLLNAKLIPIIQEFIESIKKALKEKGIDAPIAIIRSDSTKMSEQYSMMKPVETILSGPASSVTGGINCTKETDCLIVDMGGTTTDISIVKNGVPLNADSGVRIGSWKTFVHGVFIDTFGLGGDSGIRVEHGRPVLLSQRRIPFCVASKKWPCIKEQLNELIENGRYHSHPLYEFLVLQKDIKNTLIYSDDEIELCSILKKEPMLIEKAALAVGRDVYTINTKRLEAEGIIIRIGLTPTDIMHVKGDFTQFDTDAPKLALEYILDCILEETGLEIEQDEFCDMVYESVKLKLYENIVRILLCDRYPDIFKNKMDEQITSLIQNSFKDREQDNIPALFKTDFSLVGIGAPTHIFLPDVAKALKTRCVIPENAKVANAIGAVVSNIRSVHQIEIRAEYDGSYLIFGPEGKVKESDISKALLYAEEKAKEVALKDAKSKGLSDDYNVDTQVITKTATAKKGREIDLGTVVIATISGKIEYN